MEFTRWINQSLPQTLLFGTYLLYFHAVMGVVFGRIGFEATFSPLGLLLVGGSIAAGIGMANDYRWGWYVGLVVSIVPLIRLVFALLAAIGILSGDLGGGLEAGLDLIFIGLFPIAQFALLAHPMSRVHQKTWFR